MSAEVPEEERQAEVLRALAHPLRLRILEVPVQEEECVCHLSALLDKPQPYVSQQLPALKEAGLVADRRDAQRIFYGVIAPGVSELLGLARSLAGLPERPQQARRHVHGGPCPKCLGERSPSVD